MTTYRPLRIAPDLPNADEGDFEDDTPPASPYQNRRPKRGPSGPEVRLPGGLSIRLPSARTLAWAAAAALVLVWVLMPRYYRPRLPRVFGPTHEPSLRWKSVDWRTYAYAAAAADEQHVCNALMLFDQLETFGSRAQRILFVPEDWEKSPDHMPDRVREYLHAARLVYNVRTEFVKVHGIRLETPDDTQKTGAHRFELPDDAGQLDPSITKFLAYGQTQYLRVIHLDTHVTLRGHLDDLFLAPPSSGTMVTRRYLSNAAGASGSAGKYLSAHMVVANPKTEEGESLFDLSQKLTWGSDYFDSEVLTAQFADHATILGHRRYGVNVAEFRREDHYDFLGNEYEDWNPERVLRDARVLVFDEWPIPKPWISWPAGMPDHLLPQCDFGPGSDADIGCRNRKIWLELYNDFRRRRKDVCRTLTLPGGRWEDIHPEDKPEDGEKDE